VPAGEVVDAKDGRPLAGVVVSDGLDVTRTGADGTFAFADRADAEFVFVTVPSAYEALRPGWFADVRGRASGSLRFELEPRAGTVPDGCRFAQVTDLHVSVDEGARLRPMIEAGVVAPPGIQVTGEVSADELRADLEIVIGRTQPDFVVASGDLADYGQREELEAYRDVITALATPVASIPGNHDHLSVLSREAIEEFFAGWRQEDTPDLSPGEAFQRAVFGGDWRRPGSGRAPWVEVMGPLYYSFDWGGCHFVAYDGEGLRRYGDDYPQDEWLAADLAMVDTGTPVVVCTHFPESRDFYRSRFGGVRLVASVSGHWHGTRVWHDGEAHHWTSSTLGFGGIDFTPRGYRVVEVDSRGARSWWETIEAPSPPTPRVTGAGAIAGDDVVVALEAPDVTGTVTKLGRWSRELTGATRGGVTVADGVVYALGLTGELLALDARTGERRWGCELDEASERWSLGRPVVVDGRLYAGSARSAHAFDGSDGTEIWRRDLAPMDWAASWSGVTANSDTVVLGSANDDLHLVALDAATGEIRWRRAGRDIAGVCVTPAIAGDLVLAVRAPGWIAAYALSDGELRWEMPLDDAWPVALVVAGSRAVVRSATGMVTAHSLDDGATLWSCDLGAGPRAARPYSRAPGGARLPLVIAGDSVSTATFDELVAIDLASGAVTHRTAVGGEIATVIGRGTEVRAVTVDGNVVSLSV
jgi:outer membrane protein assembly factor BamB/predicted MPP superfamily phosphohydrolase